MESTISIKKVSYEGRDYPAIKFNTNEDIDMAFVQESVFALIIAAIRPLADDDKKLLLQSIKANMFNLFDKPEEEVFDFFINQCKTITT